MKYLILIVALSPILAGCNSDREIEREILISLDQAHMDFVQSPAPSEKVKALNRRVGILESSRTVGVPKERFIAGELCFTYLRIYVWESAQGNYQAAREALVKADEINRSHSLGVLKNIDLTDPIQAAFITKSIQTLDEELAKSFAKDPVVR
ncbi:MAG: hypothetical protein HS122_06380 [Opitutaceae bacterium]|nr:hypothetical protein [Opitutaceae bacterium]